MPVRPSTNIAVKTMNVPPTSSQNTHLPLVSWRVKPNTFGNQKVTPPMAANTVTMTTQWKCAITKTPLWVM